MKYLEVLEGGVHSAIVGVQDSSVRVALIRSWPEHAYEAYHLELKEMYALHVAAHYSEGQISVLIGTDES